MSLENLSLANCPISDEGLEGVYILIAKKTKEKNLTSTVKCTLFANFFWFVYFSHLPKC